ncbi:MAG TPA: lysophospholipid acyltransferase family protein [Acidimicrobiales bacterium]
MARDVGQLNTVARAVLKPLFAFAWRIEIEGIECIPETGGAIMAPNHLSVLDHFILGATVPRRITFVGKGEYMDSWKTKYIFPALGMIPIDRSGGSAAEGALNAAAGVLEAGELFGIYPEGTRSRDGRLHKGHTGAARLALRTGCPIVPVGLQGTLEVQPPDSSMPKPFKVMRVRFGRPVKVDRYRDRADDRLVLRQITDEVMYEIRELSGQEYVDTYATKRSEDLPAETAVIGGAPSGNGQGGPPSSNGNGLRERTALPESAAS